MLDDGSAAPIDKAREKNVCFGMVSEAQPIRSVFLPALVCSSRSCANRSN